MKVMEFEIKTKKSIYRAIYFSDKIQLIDYYDDSVKNYPINTKIDLIIDYIKNIDESR